MQLIINGRTVFETDKYPYRYDCLYLRLSQDKFFCPVLSCTAGQDRTGCPAGPTLFLSYIRFVVIYHTNMCPSLSFKQVRFYSFHTRIRLPTVFLNLFINTRPTQLNTNFASDFGFDLEFFRTRFKIKSSYFRPTALSQMYVARHLSHPIESESCRIQVFDLVHARLYSTTSQ